jgi:hypothetical protein
MAGKCSPDMNIPCGAGKYHNGKQCVSGDNPPGGKCSPSNPCPAG